MGTIKLLVLIGSFFGGLLYAFRGLGDGDTIKRDGAVEKKLTDVMIKTEEIQGEIESLKSIVADSDRDTKRAIQTILRKMESLDNQEIDDMRHEEVMKILRIVEKKWKR